jgi:hypothetical protein
VLRFNQSFYSLLWFRHARGAARRLPEAGGEGDDDACWLAVTIGYDVSLSPQGSFR